MDFGQGLAFVFRESWAFMRQAWWLALLPALPRWLYNSGIPFLDADLIEPLAWGEAAATSLLYSLSTYWIVRFVILERDLSAALSATPDTVRTFLPFVVAVTLATFLLERWLPQDLGWTLVLQVGVLLVLQILISLWAVTAPSGSAVMGPTRSARLVLPHMPWAIAINLTLTLLLAIALAVLTYLSTKLPLWQWQQVSLGPMLADAAVVPLDAFWSVAFVVAFIPVARKAGLQLGGANKLSATFE